MAAKKTNKVTVELEIEAIERLLNAAEALSELAAASITGCDDPKVKALGKKKKGKKK